MTETPSEPHAGTQTPIPQHPSDAPTEIENPENDVVQDTDTRINPWQSPRVTVGLDFVAVENRTRHRKALQNAIKWMNEDNVAAYDVTFQMVNSSDADVVVQITDSISDCQSGTPDEYLNYCSRRLEQTSEPNSPEIVQIKSRYAQPDTRRIYRGALATLGGVDDLNSYDAATMTSDAELKDPWPANSPVTVRIEGAENYEAAERHVSAAIEYWESGEGSQYRNYSVDMELRPNASTADIVVRYVDRIDQCGIHNSDFIAGCAPAYSGEFVADETVVRINQQYEIPSQRRIVIHEFGHIFGRLHGQEPTDIMQAESRLIQQPQTDARNKNQPWVEDTITVYVDASSLNSVEEDSLDSETNAVLEHLNEDAGSNVPDSVTFERASNREDANIVIEVDEGDDYASTQSLYGIDLDDDDYLESYSRQIITISEDTEENHYAYHIGYWVIGTFGERPADIDGNGDDRTGWPE